MALCRFFMIYTFFSLAFSSSALENAWDKPWYNHFKSEKSNIEKLLNILAQSPHGKKTIELSRVKAKSHGKKLLEVIGLADFSYTDTTFIRKLSPENKYFYETQALIKINRHHNLTYALLDLAHEMIHYSLKHEPNPYEKGFSLEKYIRSTVEAQGGEVDAFINECYVAQEIFGISKMEKLSPQCKKLKEKGSSEHFSRLKGVKEFYHLGIYYGHLKQKLQDRGRKKDFPLLSRAEPQFISSAWGVPYPIAAMREYESLISKVCQNNRRRSVASGESLSEACIP